MRKPTGTTDPNLSKLLVDLKRQSSNKKAPLWKEVARLLQLGRRRRITLNVSKLNRLTQKDDLIIVPGKLLGTGTLDHPIIVSAWNFSKIANEKIKQAGGKCLTIPEMMKTHPQGKLVRIMA